MPGGARRTDTRLPPHPPNANGRIAQRSRRWRFHARSEPCQPLAKTRPACRCAATRATRPRASRTVEIQGKSLATGLCQTVATHVFYILLDEHGEERGKVVSQFEFPQRVGSGHRRRTRGSPLCAHLRPSHFEGIYSAADILQQVDLMLVLRASHPSCRTQDHSERSNQPR